MIEMPPRSVRCPAAHSDFAYRVLVGAGNPTLCPIHAVRTDGSYIIAGTASGSNPQIWIFRNWGPGHQVGNFFRPSPPVRSGISDVACNADGTRFVATYWGHSGVYMYRRNLDPGGVEYYQTNSR